VPSADPASSAELDAVIEQYREAQEAFCKGDPEPLKPLHSRRDDLTLANPLGPVRRGWTEVEEAIEQAAANFHGSGEVHYEELSAALLVDAWLSSADSLGRGHGTGDGGRDDPVFGVPRGEPVDSWPTGLPHGSAGLA
jgi:hypothetical protein